VGYTLKSSGAFILGVTIALATYSAAIAKTAPVPQVIVSKGLPLWQGLKTGMEPSEVASALQSMEGIKEVRILPERKGKPQKRLKVTVKDGGIAISEIRFQPDTEFGEGLRKVSLAGSSICASTSAEKFAELRNALMAKYGEQIFGPTEITPLLLIQLLNRSQISREAEKIIAAFKNADTAVLMSFGVARRSRPAFPDSNDNLAAALWRLSDALYTEQKNKCRGTGDELAEVAIVYMSAEELEGTLKIENDRQNRNAEEVKSKL
jgi:hypothetical protein